MLPSSLFYTKNALKHIQPYIKHGNSVHQHQIDKLVFSKHRQLIQFPINFSVKGEDYKNIKFYHKYLSSNIYQQLFKMILASVQCLSHNKQLPPELTSVLQPKLKQKIKLYCYQNPHTKLILENIDVRSTKILQNTIIEGVFMHRTLNMPAQCYSLQIKNEKHIILRMRQKFGKFQHLQLLHKRKKTYDDNNYEMERYYLDGYQNWVKHQYVDRLLIQVNSVIKGTLIVNQKQQISLPINSKDNISTHLLQVQRIKVPGKTDIQNHLITDIDYFMKGNPFTEQK